MTLREALNKALEIIGNRDIDLNDPDSEETKKLVSCGNMIYGELTEEYVFLRHSEEVAARDGKIMFSSLAYPLKDVVRVKIGDRNIPYGRYNGFIRVYAPASLYTVVYNYHAESVELDDELILPTTFSAVSIAPGIASEYFYRSGLIEEALFYKNRYDNTLLNLTRRKPSATLVYRRFI